MADCANHTTSWVGTDRSVPEHCSKSLDCCPVMWWTFWTVNRAPPRKSKAGPYNLSNIVIIYLFSTFVTWSKYTRHDLVSHLYPTMLSKQNQQRSIIKLPESRKISYHVVYRYLDFRFHATISYTFAMIRTRTSTVIKNMNFSTSYNIFIIQNVTIY
jgi:hypothetical protein